MELSAISAMNASASTAVTVHFRHPTSSGSAWATLPIVRATVQTCRENSLVEGPVKPLLQGVQLQHSLGNR